jgi:hypothetical protein
MKITKKELEKLYKENPNKVVCEKLGITNPTLVSYLKKLGIEQKGKGRHNHTTKIKLMVK